MLPRAQFRRTNSTNWFETKCLIWLRKSFADCWEHQQLNEATQTSRRLSSPSAKTTSSSKARKRFRTSMRCKAWSIIFRRSFQATSTIQSRSQNVSTSWLNFWRMRTHLSLRDWVAWFWLYWSRSQRVNMWHHSHMQLRQRLHIVTRGCWTTSSNRAQSACKKDQINYCHWHNRLCRPRSTCWRVSSSRSFS